MNSSENKVASSPLSVIAGSPLVAPPFNGKIKRAAERFFWWSWHPLYTYWSKSCWGGVTQQQAIEARKIKTGGDWLENYHNKLILENDDGTLTEVLDSPCQRLDVWERCRDLQANSDSQTASRISKSITHNS